MRFTITKRQKCMRFTLTRNAVWHDAKYRGRDRLKSALHTKRLGHFNGISISLNWHTVCCSVSQLQCVANSYTNTGILVSHTSHTRDVIALKALYTRNVWAISTEFRWNDPNDPVPSQATTYTSNKICIRICDVYVGLFWRIRASLLTYMNHPSPSQASTHTANQMYLRIWEHIRDVYVTYTRDIMTYL